MKKFFEFVQAALEAFDSGEGFTRFDVTEASWEMPYTKAQVDAYKAKKAADKAAKENSTAAASPPVADHSVQKKHDTEIAKKQTPAYKSRSRSDKEVGKHVTMKAIKQSQHDYGGKHAEKLHRLAADVHKHLGNHARAARHSKAADLMSKRAGSAPTAADHKKDAGFHSKVKLHHYIKTLDDKAAATKKRNAATSHVQSLASLSQYKNSHH